MQILTMEYVPGIKINKIQALDQLGVDRKRLMSSDIFSSTSVKLKNWWLAFEIQNYHIVYFIFYRLGRYAVESYLEQILSHGFFHADPVRTVIVLRIVELSLITYLFRMRERR